MANTVDIELRVRAEAALAELRKLPGMTEKEARIMVGALGRQWKEAEKQSSKAAAQMAREFDKGIDSIKGSAEKIAGMIGGPVGDVADLALDLGERMSKTAGAIGATGAAAGVAATAVAAIAVSFVSLSNAALEARDRLAEAGLAAELPDAALQSLAEYEAATSDLSVAMDRLTVLIGSQTADALAGMVGLLAQGVEAMASISSAAMTAGTQLNALAETAQTIARTMTAITSLGLSEVLIEQADAAKQAAVGVVSTADAYAALGMVSEDAEADAAALANRLRDQAQAAEEARQAAQRKAAADKELASAAEEAEDQARRLAAAVADLSDQSADLTVNMGTAAMVINTTGAELPKVASKWERASEAVQHFAESANAIAQSAGFTASFGALQSLGELQSVLHEQSVSELQDRIDRRREEITEFRDGELERIDALVRSGAISGKEAAARRQEVYAEAQARREAMRQRTADEREAALRSFRAGQALAVSTAIIDAATAALALIPAFLFLGPAAPIGAATASGLALAAQLATIRAQKPPEFPMGRLPMSSDHTQIAALQPSEAVLTQRGVATLGGPSGVQAANDGRGMAGGRMFLQLDRRTLAEVVIETGRTATVDPRRGKIDPWRG